MTSYPIVLNFEEAAGRWEDIIGRTEAGETFIISVAGVPKVKLEPLAVNLAAAPGMGSACRPLQATVNEVRAFFTDIRPADGLLSDELVRDRREVADRERRS